MSRTISDACGNGTSSVFLGKNIAHEIRIEQEEDGAEQREQQYHASYLEKTKIYGQNSFNTSKKYKKKLCADVIKINYAINYMIIYIYIYISCQKYVFAINIICGEQQATVNS